MTEQEFAARLVALEHKASTLVSEIHLLFQDVLDSINEHSVE